MLRRIKLIVKVPRKVLRFKDTRKHFMKIHQNGGYSKS